MVKRLLAMALALMAALSIAACGGNGAGGTTAPTSTSSAAPGGADLGRGDESESPPTPTVPPIPPDSIWTFKGELAHRQVLEEGYYVDYTAELDFVKLDGAYPSGQYIGDVYISLKLNAEDYIKDMLKNLPDGYQAICIFRIYRAQSFSDIQGGLRVFDAFLGEFNREFKACLRCASFQCEKPRIHSVSPLVAIYV